MDVVSKVFMVEGLKTAISEIRAYISKKSLTASRKARIIEAIHSIQLACIKTESFISDDGYIKNTILSEHWLDAMRASQKADLEQLPRRLFHKARFWSNPNKWLNNEASMVLIPKLKELNRECEDLLVKLGHV